MTEPIEGIVYILETNGEPTGDTMMAWCTSGNNGITRRSGVDLKIGNSKVQVSMTAKRRVLRIFVNGQEWKSAE